MYNNKNEDFNEQEYISRVKRRKKFKKQILLIICGIFGIFIIYRLIVCTPVSQEERMKQLVYENVLNNLIRAIENNNVSEYQKFFTERITDEEKKFILAFNKNKNDKIKYEINNPKLNIYPSGVIEVIEIEARTIMELFINNRKIIKEYYYYYQRAQDNKTWRISKKSYKDKTKLYMNYMNN